MASGEERWFAVRLEQGQGLSLVVTIPGEREYAASTDQELVLVEVYNPAGERITYTFVGLGGEPSSKKLATKPVGDQSSLIAANALVAAPGLYAIRVQDDSARRRSPRPGVRFDAELLVEVTGNAPSPSSSPSTTAAPESAAASPADEHEPSGGKRALNAGLAALLGLVVGASAAAVIPRVRR
jgi:hypothetical protein